LDPPILSSLSPRPVNADANTNPDLATISLSAHFGPWAHTASWALIIYSFASFLALLLLWCLGFVDSGLNVSLSVPFPFASLLLGFAFGEKGDES
jgi:hypothetical protein